MVTDGPLLQLAACSERLSCRAQALNVGWRREQPAPNVIPLLQLFSLLPSYHITALWPLYYWTCAAGR